MSIREANRERGLYFVEDGKIIYAPKDWADEIGEESEDGEGWEFQCYHGGYGEPLAYQERAGNEWLTTDVICWVTVKHLEGLQQVDEAQARQIDPDLFTLLDAINSGEAK